MIIDFFKRGSNNGDQPQAMSDTAREMVEKCKFPYEVFPEGSNHSDIMKRYEEKLREGKEKGFTPVIVPVDETLEEYWEIFEDEEYSLEDTIRGASSEEGKKFLHECYEEMLDDTSMSEEEYVGEFDDEPDTINHVTAFMEFGAPDTLETIIFEVPTTNPWEVVAYLPFGGWNECPNPDKMVSVCKYWFEKYGAVPVTITHEIMEMSVPECVSAGDALELAKEHYAFCPDRVDQGTRTGTISEVAASLEVSKIWYFWWD